MDLEQHVSELVEELAVVTPVCGVCELVSLLDRVGDDRALVLLAVPRALKPQLVRDLVEARDRRGGGRVGVAGGGGRWTQPVITPWWSPGFRS